VGKGERMRSHAGLATAILLVAGAAACGSAFDTSAALAGTWTLTPQGVPGSGLQFTISSDAGTVTGTGTRFIEAGPTLTFTVSGTASGEAVDLTFAYATGGSETFSGQLTPAIRLKGSLRTLSGTTDVEFSRIEAVTDPP